MQYDNFCVGTQGELAENPFRIEQSSVLDNTI